jgi:uncharacterized protein YdeI (YjbR/CyaY-like superfamily)
MAKDPLPLLTFVDCSAFEAWLAAQTADAEGAWLRFAKQGAPEQTIAKAEAIDCALAYGWIDGQLGRVEDFYFKARFTPRRPASPWSQANRERAERLIADGRMQPSGQAEVDRAKTDGRWERAYARQSDATPSADLEAALDASPTARILFDTLDAANRFAVIYRVQQARTPDKRASKIAELVGMLARGETIHPRRTAKSIR